MPSKKSQAFDTLFQSIVDPPEVGVGQDQVEGLVPLDASNIEAVTSEFDRIRQEEDPSILDRFSEFFTPLIEKGRKNSRYLAPKSEAIVRMSDPEVLSLLEPRMERATKSETAKSIMPAPGKFFNPAAQGYKGEKFATGLQSAGVDVDLEYGNYVMFGDGRPKDVTNQTFQNLYVSPRTSYKYSAGQNKATARANPYEGPTLTVEEMQKNYKQNTGAAGAKIQTNLLQPSQFKIKTSSDQTRTLDHPIVAVEGKGKHHYALDMQMVGPVRMNQLTKKVKRKKKDGTVVEELPQPNLRPVTVGDVTLGNVIGYITVQGNDHPLYDYIEVDGTSSAPDEMKSSNIEKFNKGGSTVLNRFSNSPDITTTREQESFDFLDLLGGLASKVSKKGSAVFDFVSSPTETGLDEPYYDDQNRLVVKEPVQRKINFDNWFKDSKVVGKDGKPLIVYHSGDFDENLNPIFNDSLQGIHFGTKAAAFDRFKGKPTEDFVKSADVYFSDQENGWVWDSNGQESLTSFGSEEAARQDLDAAALEVEANQEIDQDDFESNTTKVFLSIKNPKYTNIDAGSDWSEVIEKAKKQGHDGIIYTNKYEDPGSRSYIIFDSRQAKSVKNKGGYDPTNPDILSFTPSKKDSVSANKGGSVEATGEMTTKGREVFREGEVQYSERTITFQMENGKWITIPSVDKEGNELTQEQLEEFVAQNGPKDPVTGEELPTFDDVEEAEKYAAQRSAELLPDDMPIMMYHGGLMGSQEEGAEGCGCASCQASGVVGYDAISGNEVPAGSAPINVRDDIPAVLSDGEYVVPADVVRYHGLKHLEEMRQEAKAGLMAMMMDGQIQTLEEEEEGYKQMEADEEEEEDIYETAEGTEVEMPDVKVTSAGMMVFRPMEKFAFMRT